LFPYSSITRPVPASLPLWFFGRAKQNKSAARRFSCPSSALNQKPPFAQQNVDIVAHGVTQERISLEMNALPVDPFVNEKPSFVRAALFRRSLSTALQEPSKVKKSSVFCLVRSPQQGR
jgi:hypothetical protein